MDKSLMFGLFNPEGTLVAGTFSKQVLDSAILEPHLKGYTVKELILKDKVVGVLEKAEQEAWEKESNDEAHLIQSLSQSIFSTSV